MIDNYDSFTYNVVRYFREIDIPVKVVLNDECEVSDLIRFRPRFLVISPGPCTPIEAGVSMDAIRHFAGVIPILGVCLGHQSIVQAFGGKIVQAGQVMHGKVSQVSHHGEGVFRGLPSPFRAARYHSLVVEESGLPVEFEVTGWTNEATGERTVMGVRHRTLPIEGVQFHPEAELTEHGHQLLQNFISNSGVLSGH